MDNVTLTFLNALADMLGVLPQKPNQTVNQQKNRGGIQSSPSQRKVTSSRQRGLRSQNSTAQVTRQPPSDIVPSQRGALTASPRGAITPSPSGAMTPATGGGAMQTGGGYQAVQVGQAAPRALPPASSGPAMSGSGAGNALPSAGRNAPSQGAGNAAKRGGPGAAIAQILGQIATDELVGKPLSELIYGLAAQVPGTAASMGLRDEEGGTGYVNLLAEDPKPLTRFADAIGPQPTAAGNAARANAQPQQPAAQDGPRQVQYPTAAEMQANAVEPVVSEAPGPVATLETPKARDWRDTMYMEARSKAMNIADPVQRQIALEGVAQMGMEFHKDYYGK